MFFDPLYLLVLLAAVGVSLWAKVRLSLACAAGRRRLPAWNLTGGEAAEAVLRATGAGMVRVAPVVGELSEFYDPRGGVVRLSRPVFEGRSVAAVGAAAHEAGHAAQDAAAYPGLPLRTFTTLAAGLVSSVFWVVLAAGVVLNLTEILVTAIAILTAGVTVQLLALPVEFDASRRAWEALDALGLVDPGEAVALRRVVDAAAWTNVAATLTGAFRLAYDLARFGAFERRSAGAVTES
jgi:Zn-dependent membrane protease YugP